MENQELGARFDRLVNKVDAVTSTLERRLDGIDAASLDHRQYTEHAFETLRAEMQAGFRRMDARFDQVAGCFTGVEAQFEQVAGGFAAIDARFDQVDSRFAGMDARFDRLEQKLDRFINTQSKQNELTERRLTLLEGETDS